MFLTSECFLGFSMVFDVLSLLIIDTYSTIISKVDPGTHQTDQGQCPYEIDSYSKREINVSASGNKFCDEYYGPKV